MVGGGIEATGRGDEFAGHLHADEHFTSRLVVVTGSFENVRDAPRTGVLLQEAEDGLPLWGVQRTGRETRQVGVISCSKPAEGRNVSVGQGNIIGKDVRLRTEGMPDGQQKMVTFISGIGDKQEVTAHGFVQRSR